MKRDELTARQITFCYEYVANKGNGAAAAKAAGCPHNNSSYTLAHKWLRLAKIQKKIEEITREHFKSLKVKAEDVLNEMAILGFSDISEYVEWGDEGATKIVPSASIGQGTRAIREIEITEQTIPGKKDDPDRVEKTIKIKLHSKEKALEMLGKHSGLLVEPEKDGDGKPKVNFNFNLNSENGNIQDKNASELARSYFELLKVLSGSSKDKV